MDYDRRLEFDSEDQLVDYIRQNLMDDSLAALLAKHDVTISDLLNGRLPWKLDPLYDMIFTTWNGKLGRMEFGF